MPCHIESKNNLIKIDTYLQSTNIRTKKKAKSQRSDFTNVYSTAVHVCTLSVGISLQLSSYACK